MITVIIPCYNASKFIRDSLESLKKQTFFDFEVICINDGSTDDTKSILEAYKSNSDLDIRIISQINAGVSAARNRGIEEARGELITFLDADDIYHEDFLRIMFSAIKYADVAYCKLSRDLTKLSTVDMDDVQDGSQKMIKDLLHHMGDFGFYCCIYKKTIINSYQLKFWENAKYGEDREFVWKYMVHCRKANYVNAKLYGYRITNGSAVNMVTWRKTDSLGCVKRVEEYMIYYRYPYYLPYKQYMYSRSMWSVAKTFATGRRKDYFNKLRKEYDVVYYMKRAFRYSNQWYVKALSAIYILSPNLFYQILCLHR